jgi:hypothetical protein
MIISIDNIIRYLLGRELIDLQSIVEEDLSIVPISGKNKDIKILRGSSKGYFLKQANQIDANGLETLIREAQFYRVVQSGSNLQQVRPMLTSMIMFDENNKIVILDLIENGRTVRQLLYDRGNEDLHAHAATSMGHVLGTVHLISSNSHDHANLSFLPRRLPPTFFLTCPTPEIFRQVSLANLQLLKIVHKFRNFHESLQELHKLWRVNSLIHGDIRLDNVVLSFSNDAQNVKTKIIDWEFVDFGDPA